MAPANLGMMSILPTGHLLPAGRRWQGRYPWTLSLLQLDGACQRVHSPGGGQLPHARTIAPAQCLFSRSPGFASRLNLHGTLVSFLISTLFPQPTTALHTRRHASASRPVSHVTEPTRQRAVGATYLNWADVYRKPVPHRTTVDEGSLGHPRVR